MCDGAGTLMLRKPVEGFAMPRFSGACPKWPLFQAWLSRPMQPMRQTVTVTGREAQRFECYAVSEPVGPIEMNVAPLYHSYMLIVPRDDGDTSEAEVGSTWSGLPNGNCAGRREPFAVGRPYVKRISAWLFSGKR